MNQKGMMLLALLGLILVGSLIGGCGSCDQKTTPPSQKVTSVPAGIFDMCKNQVAAQGIPYDSASDSAWTAAMEQCLKDAGYSY